MRTHRRAAPTTATVLPLLVVWAAAAVWTVAAAADMRSAGGTMGQGPAAFTLMWTVMMAAMMLPAATPVAMRYLDVIERRRLIRGTLFVAGYLSVWGASGLAAYVLALGADAVIALGDPAPQVFAAAVFAMSGVYHLTSVKARLLGRCRNPFGLVLTYAAYRGATRDLRAGSHHGLTCLGCCWSLMALMLVVGVMNVVAMLALGVVVAAEKLWAQGTGFAKVAGLASLALAVAVLWVPGLAVGVTGGATG